MILRRAALLLSTFAAAWQTAWPVRGEPLRVMTFNIRYANTSDGENGWEFRKPLLMKVIRDFDPDLLGVQEALRRQMDELAAALPEMSNVGVGREPDGGGEYSAIFYRRERFDVCAADTFWLSDEPQSPGSHTWGNELPRICTWARFLDRRDARRFTLFNTHWDHQSQPARLASGRMMAMRISDLAITGEPIVVTGDFNATEDNPAIVALTRDGELLVDAYRRVHPDDAGLGTFHGFSGQNATNRIDAVFVAGPWQIEAAEIVHTHEGTVYPSDHFPVTAVISLQAAKASN